jgi:hypothetical protein
MRSTLTIGLFAACLAMASCAPALQASNERGGVVRHTRFGTNLDGALALADKQCEQFGRTAEITDGDLIFHDTITYRCVGP